MKIQVGDRVHHLEFGDGTVLRVYGSSDPDILFDGDASERSVSVNGLTLVISLPTIVRTASDIIPRKAARNKIPRVTWTDRRTGEQFSANQEFINRLPAVLGIGEKNIQSVRAILELLGGSYTDDPNGSKFANDSRQLRDAKQYLVTEKNIPIVAVQSQRGGYYIADEPSGLLENAAAFRAQAAGLVQVAESLEALATNMGAVVV
jgi:hypothetical protein